MTQIELHLQYLQSGLRGRICGSQRGTLLAGFGGCFRVSLVALWAGKQVHPWLGRSCWEGKCSLPFCLPLPWPELHLTPQGQGPLGFLSPAAFWLMAAAKEMSHLRRGWGGACILTAAGTGRSADNSVEFLAYLPSLLPMHRREL